DDAAKLRGDAKGISIKFRLAVEGVLGIGLALALASTLAAPAGGVPLAIPGLGAVALPVALFALLSVFTIAGSVNAVNVSDGLDGLASGLTALTAVGLAVGAAAVALPAGAAALGMAPVSGAGEVAVFAAAVAGGCAGFMWHNCHPARVFMGNVGAAGLGGALGAITIAARLEVLLIIAGAVLVAEAGSVILQIAAFRLFGRRIFRIAPIHHSFQFRGWHESAVTTRFWLAGAAALAVAAAIWPLPA
ncbi:MAG: MraY family glycosyltransferase, partial [Planctomycetota bacterium]